MSTSRDKFVLIHCPMTLPSGSTSVLSQVLPSGGTSVLSQVLPSGDTSVLSQVPPSGVPQSCHRSYPVGVPQSCHRSYPVGVPQSCHRSYPVGVPQSCHRSYPVGVPQSCHRSYPVGVPQSCHRSCPGEGVPQNSNTPWLRLRYRSPSWDWSTTSPPTHLGLESSWLGLGYPPLQTWTGYTAGGMPFAVSLLSTRLIQHCRFRKKMYVSP